MRRRAPRCWPLWPRSLAWREAFRPLLTAIVEGASAQQVLALHDGAAPGGLREALEAAARANALLAEDHEIEGLIRALDGRFVRRRRRAGISSVRRRSCRRAATCMVSTPTASRRPSPAPTAPRRRRGVIARHLKDGNSYPETIALVLWGTDNLKSEGAPIAQALALIGAKPRFDAYRSFGRGRPHPAGDARPAARRRGDDALRDFPPTCCRCRSSSSRKRPSSRPPPKSRRDQNFIRKHALAYQAKHGCDLETAALRVFSNAMAPMAPTSTT